MERELLRRLFEARGGLAWGELVAGVHGRHALRHVCRLVLEGRVDFDRSQPIQPSTTLHWAVPTSEE